ncbi:hypothetical protein DFH01_11465 [Falsiroseomonas bella]|uniref:Uncharacterized protein n=1 Tax=Falsiroseomonas bella TaxID=2184016 RepID=A0A317FF92_9PROT|nr:hypothetical protein [Falsiroseomonas bella]PWS37445.1 hypothetical protein DFH01_11465 [Falsiroseomonas bella]
MFEGGIAISLPGRHAAGLQVSGSVFAPEELGGAVLPPELRLAADLVVEAARSRGLPVRFVARPEVFTHGILAETLAARLEGATDHVALCDGTAFRPLPGLRNHLFFYRRGVPQAWQQMRRLVEVAPELFLGVASQINGTLAFRFEGAWHRPPVTLLAFEETPRITPAAILPVFCNPGDPEGSAAGALAEEAAEDAPPLPPDPLRYVPLTEAMLADADFTRVLAERLLGAMMRDEAPLVLQLPLLAAGSGDIAEQIAAVVRALGRTGVTFPRHAGASVRWATAPLELDLLRGASILVHPGLDFWRLGRDIWHAAGEIEIVQDGPAGASFLRLFGEWIGAEVPRRLLHPRRSREHVTVGSVL